MASAGRPQLIKRAFPDTLAVLPSETYVFDTSDERIYELRILVRRKMPNGVEVVVTDVGVFGLNFAGSSLGGFERLVFQGQGEIPDAVRINSEAMIALQANRLRIATLAAACVFGVYCERNHISLVGVLHPTLEDIYGWREYPSGFLQLGLSDLQRLQPRLSERVTPRGARSIKLEDAEEGLALADRLLAAAPSYAAADPIAMVTMAYQAMVLHGRQHAGASIALSAVVVEAAVEELVLAFGMVSGTAARIEPKKPLSGVTMSRGTFKDLGFGGMIKVLAEAGLLDSYLVTRIEELRKARNALMHEVQEPVPNASGNALTAVRDVLRLCTGEAGFELNTAFTYRE